PAPGGPHRGAAHFAGGGQVAGDVDAVLGVDLAPAALEGFPVGTAVAGRAPVVHVDHGDAAAGEVLHAEFGQVGHAGGGAAVAGHHQRRALPRRGAEVRVGGRVV